ncbi:ABC transporter permease [Erysipelothrix rhusiopathiae]|uniref:ABC transporter permease n=1 Tax=Erysipelothrix rhusiopathiae TaxID=1648 RepID=UPI001EDEFBF6|nr:ABC transporter permease [Erysipelothrix rhusiopathiae]MCG4436139.1 ABC transporter permease [Erysipelothrix rhusiopathiae]MCG4456760.1 ABC transporter permease [Erysipelothrix rhusiopathiae]MDE8032535.1 ABC transporter permease [Erysipelothrix rhusiopathiae]MDE8036042.1 ABC transporter permease [Erysipelothrix rhusiopathiae]MDE8038766.1 ABC transporter permease [Erysipelothrix rhusiopathiae]
MNTLAFIVQQMLYVAIPLIVVSLGGLFSERGGIVNIALEGIMVFGTFFGVITLFFLQNHMSGQLLYIVAMLAAILAGVVMGAVHAFAAINMNADQTISGTAINMFAPAFTVYIARLLYSVKEIPFRNEFLIRKVPFLSEIPVIGKLFFTNAYISTYIGIAILFIATFVIYKTRFGLRLRSAGENPHALDAAGGNVKRIRWAGVLISGALAGLGGLIITVPISTSFTGTANGYGFLALAILIFGQWRPKTIFFSSLFFALALTLSNVYSGIPFLNGLGIPDQVFKMLPYIATLVVLVFTSKKSAAPKAAGQPYDAGKR